MGRTYAAILGTLALAVTLGRDLLAGTAGEGTLLHGWWAMLMAAVAGATLGTIAGAAVDESALRQVERETAARQPTQESVKTTK